MDYNNAKVALCLLCSFLLTIALCLSSCNENNQKSDISDNEYGVQEIKLGHIERYDGPCLSQEDLNFEKDIAVYVGLARSTGSDPDTGVYKPRIETTVAIYKDGKIVDRDVGIVNLDSGGLSALHRLLHDDSFKSKSIASMKEYFTSDSTWYNEINDDDIRIAVLNGNWDPFVTKVRYVQYDLDSGKEPKDYWIASFKELLDKGTLNGFKVDAVTDRLIERGIIPCVSPIVIYESWEWTCDGHKYDIVNACNIAFESHSYNSFRWYVLANRQYPGTTSSRQHFMGFYDRTQYEKYGDYSEFLTGTNAVYNMTLLFIDGKPVNDSIYYSEPYREYPQKRFFPILVYPLSLGYKDPEFTYFGEGISGGAYKEVFYETFQKMKDGNVVKTLGYVSDNYYLESNLSYSIGYFDESGDWLILGEDSYGALNFVIWFCKIENGQVVWIY
jgi:hypothetical protein